MRFNPLDFPIIFQFPQRCSGIVDWWGHIPFASFLVDAIRPKLLVELGVYRGDSFSAFCQSIQALELDKTGSKAIGIDAFIGDENTGPQLEADIQNLFTFVEKRFPFASLRRAYFDEVVDDFTPDSIDILHIDGCHRSEAVWNDFNKWLPKLAPNGVMLFHDIAIGGTESCGVDVVWKDLIADYPDSYFDFPHSWGLGCLSPKGIPSSLSSLYSSVGTPDEAKIQTFFQLQGARTYVQTLYRLHYGDTLLLEGINAGPLVSDPTTGSVRVDATYTYDD